MSATPTIVADIGVNSSGSYPVGFQDLGGVAYFFATSPNLGAELWRSDGTVAGTTLVKDIRPGVSSSVENVASDPTTYSLTNVSGTLYFVANDGTSGLELWKSDGTAAGTMRVKDIRPGSGNAFDRYTPPQLVNLNGVLHFIANDGTTGIELWRSDGTESGTFLVKDIAPGFQSAFSSSSGAGFLTTVGSLLYFAADESVGGRELWKSDGTLAGTQRVVDIQPGSSDSSPVSLTNVDGVLYFIARHPVAGEEIFRSEGTAATTTLVADLAPGISSSNPLWLTNVGGTLFFTSRGNESLNDELWKVDGGVAARVKDIRLGSSSSDPSHLTASGNLLYFVANDGGSGRELWRSDGTEAGTYLVADVRTGGQGSLSTSILPNLTAIGDLLYFVANDGSTGSELWRTDGTAAGTTLVRDINDGAGSPFTSINDLLLNRIGTRLFFAASDGVSGRELWVVDSPSATARRVHDIYGQGEWGSPTGLTSFDGAVYFWASDRTNGIELWHSDGTDSGTRRITNISNGSGSAVPFSPVTPIVPYNGALYFAANDGSASGVELWRTDGTAAGAVRIRDVFPGSAGASIEQLTVAGNLLYFVANDGVHGAELWRTDGTEAGTLLVKDIAAGDQGSSVSWLTNVDGKLYFVANDGVSGLELWRANDEGVDAAIVADLGTGAFGSAPRFLTMLNGSLLFAATDAETGAELWRFDPLLEQAELVRDIRSGQQGSEPAWLTNANGTLLFVADDGIYGTELWKSDGTTTGTLLVSDVRPDGSGFSNSMNPSFAAIGGLTLFTANDGIHGRELWKTDGAAGGTALVKDVYAGSASSAPANGVNVSGVYYYAANDGQHGVELWRSDGSLEGTFLVAELNQGFTSPTTLINHQGVLYFAGTDPQLGNELWKLAPDPVAMTAGDYDQNGVTDGADFLKWQRAFGSADFTNDGDNDGTVGSGDLDAWEDNFGSPESASPAGGVAAAVAAILADEEAGTDGASTTTTSQGSLESIAGVSQRAREAIFAAGDFSLLFGTAHPASEDWLAGRRGRGARR